MPCAYMISFSLSFFSEDDEGELLLIPGLEIASESEAEMQKETPSDAQDSDEKANGEDLAFLGELRFADSD